MVQLSVPDGVTVQAEEFMVAYLTPTLTNVGVSMEQNSPMPFFLVRRVSGREDMISDHPVLSIHCFDLTRTAASDAAQRMHAAMKALTAKTSVTVEGTVYSVDSRNVVENPIWVDYEDKTVHRYVGRYRLGLRLN